MSIFTDQTVFPSQIDLATNEVEYLHADSNGSVIAATTDDGCLAGTTNYGAYGKRLGSAVSRFGFAGEWTDPVTGYVFLRARWYDPATASFLSRDPLSQMTMESYGYAGGNPLSRVDPSGLFWGSTPVISPEEVTAGARNMGRHSIKGIEKFKRWSHSEVGSNVGSALAVIGLGTAILGVTVLTGGVGGAIILGVGAASTVGGTAISAANASAECDIYGGDSPECIAAGSAAATNVIPYARPLSKMSRLAKTKPNDSRYLQYQTENPRILNAKIGTITTNTGTSLLSSNPHFIGKVMGAEYC